MLSGFAEPVTACLFGGSGGIGAALVHALSRDPMIKRLFVGARNSDAIASGENIVPFAFDLLDEDSIADAAAIIGAAGPVHLAIVATGLLHDGDSMQPERAARSQTANAYARAFAINATGPALIAKHVLPFLPRAERSVFVALSARVSSIGDNRLGGWHAYRASKAALNMIIRNLAIEQARRNPDSIVFSYHPGTVDTGLSRPFQANVPDEKLFSPGRAADYLLDVIDRAQPADSGRIFAWDGSIIPY